MNKSFLAKNYKCKLKLVIFAALVMLSSSALAIDPVDFNNPNFRYSFENVNNNYTEYLDESDVHYKRGMDFYRSNQYTKAIEAFKKALELAPDRSTTRVNLAVTYINRGTYLFNKEKQNEAAASDYRNAIYYLKYGKYIPTSKSARENLKIAEINIKNVLDALNIDADDKSERLKTAKALRGQGKFTDAVVEYNAALRGNILDREIYEALGDLSRVLLNNKQASDYYQKAVVYSKKDANLHLKLARALHDSGDSDNAVKEFNIALETSKEGQKDEILSTLESIWIERIKKNPRDASAHMNLGVVLQKKGNYDAALKEYNIAGQLNPNDITTRLNLGTLYQARKNYKTAIRAYDTIIQVKPNHVLAHYYKGTALREMGKLKDAIGAFQFVLSKEPNNKLAKEALFETVKLFPKQNDVINILGTFARNNPRDPFTQFRFAYQLHSMKRLDEAMEYYRKTLQADPNYTDAYLNIASILKEKNQIPVAVATLENALKLMPGNKKIDDMLTLIKSEAATTRYHNALQMHNRGDYKLAIKEYKNIIQISEPNADLYVNLGAAYQATKNIDEAINAYRKAVEIDDTNSTAYYYLGTSYLSKDDYDTALKTFQKARALAPEDQNIKQAIESSKQLITGKLLEKGVEEYNQGKYKQALLTLNTALITSPENADVYFQRGLVYDSLQKYPLAIGDYKLAIKYNPDLTIAYYTLAVDYDIIKNFQEAKKWYQKFVDKSEDQEDEYVKYSKERIGQI